MKTYLRWAVTLAAGTLLTVCSAFAIPITVNNFSFEQIFGSALGTGCGGPPACSYSVGPIPGWTTTPSSAVAGQFRPGPSPSPFFTAPLPNGITDAYSNTAGSMLTQTVTTLAQAGVTYTLLVDLGHRLDYPFVSAADLLINGIPHVATGVVPTSGNWSTFTTTYTAIGADTGSAITIRLLTSGLQSEFDNVRLSDSTVSGVPEPEVMGMIGAGFVALALFARRRK